MRQKPLTKKYLAEKVVRDIQFSECLFLAQAELLTGHPTFLLH